MKWAIAFDPRQSPFASGRTAKACVTVFECFASDCPHSSGGRCLSLEQNPLCCKAGGIRSRVYGVTVRSEKLDDWFRKQLKRNKLSEYINRPGEFGPVQEA